MGRGPSNELAGPANARVTAAAIAIKNTLRMVRPRFTGALHRCSALDSSNMVKPEGRANTL